MKINNETDVDSDRDKGDDNDSHAMAIKNYKILKLFWARHMKFPLYDIKNNNTRSSDNNNKCIE